MRWFRRLLKLLPADFQADYARDMERTFAAQHREAARGGLRGVAALWWETLRDLLRTAPHEHLDQLAQDTRYALRGMARRPGFAAVAVLVLGGGIAATTAVFGIVQAALLAPVPFDRPDRLAAIRERNPDDPQPWELSYVSYTELQRDAASFEQLAAYMPNGVLLGGTPPEPIDSALVSANLFDTVGVRPIAGRGFSAAEDAPGGAAVAVVGEAFAQQRFGSPERALDASIVIDERATTIVGVLPGHFRFPNEQTQVWLPIGPRRDLPFMRNRAVHVALVIGRLRGGVSIETARAEVEAWMRATQAREPSADPKHTILVRTLAEQISAGARPAVTALACAVLLLLAVTCSGVALLFLTRAAGRSHEMAVRLSLGASRMRLARQLVTEALCFAVLGGALGVAGAHVLLAYLVRGLGEALPPLVPPAIGADAVAVAAATATAAAVVCGLTPAARALRPVRDSASRPQRSQRYLVAAQVAVACVLLVLATLLGRSLDRLLRVDLGFAVDRLLVMRVNAPLAYGQPGRMTRFYGSVIDRVGALPGVVSATATSVPPVHDGSFGDLTIDGEPQAAAPLATYRRVLPGYFQALGIPLIEGRDFTARDDGAGERVVVVSRALARRFWPAGAAVGKRIKVGPADREPWMRIVGVVGDVRNGALADGFDLATYEPHAQRPWNGMFVMLRTSTDARLMMNEAERAVREVEPRVIVSDVSTMEDRIEETVASRRFHATVVGAFAAATIVLVGLALYGVLAYSVASRTRELGIRSAVGASSAALVGEVLVDGMWPALAGVAAGLAGGAAAASAARPLLFGITPGDPATYATVAAIVLVVAGASAFFPARRAARVDPSIALRTE